MGAKNETQCLADGGAGADLVLTDGIGAAGVFGVASLELAAWERTRSALTGQWTMVADGRTIRSVGRRSQTAETLFTPAA
jgi:hypothetical protein